MDGHGAQIAFFRKFAHLYDSGVALAEALRLACTEADGELADAVDGVLDDIYRGNSLADSMAARPQSFSEDIVGLIRSGEQRGDLGGAARSVADGLGRGVLDAIAVSEEAVEALLLAAGDARLLHVAPDGSLRARSGDALMPLEDRAPAGATAGLLQRAGMEGVRGGRGSFLWEDRLVRVASSSRAMVLRISEAPGAVSDPVRAWRDEPQRLLVVRGGRCADFDGSLRQIARAFDPEDCVRVGVDLPVPEVLDAPDLTTALALDPDLLLLRRADIDSMARVADALAQGVRVAVAAYSLLELEGFDDASVWDV